MNFAEFFFCRKNLLKLILKALIWALLGIEEVTPRLTITPDRQKNFSLHNFERYVNNAIAVERVFGADSAERLRRKIFEFYLGSATPAEAETLADADYRFYLQKYNEVK